MWENGEETRSDSIKRKEREREIIMCQLIGFLTLRLGERLKFPHRKNWKKNLKKQKDNRKYLQNRLFSIKEKVSERKERAISKINQAIMSTMLTSTN